MARESSRVAESHVIKAESQLIKEECDSLFINLKVKQNPEGSAESLNVEDGDEIDAMLSLIGGDKHRHYNTLLYTPVPSPALPPHSLQSRPLDSDMGMASANREIQVVVIAWDYDIHDSQACTHAQLCSFDRTASTPTPL
jgi:hypothetical protein